MFSDDEHEDGPALSTCEWYTPIKITLPTQTPQLTTQPNPLDPRTQTHIPLQDRLDSRLTNKRRQKLPRKIPLDHINPHADPRNLAAPPIPTPGMERTSQMEQI